MFKRTVGKELRSLRDYHKTLVYTKSPTRETYFTNTPANEDILNSHISQGYTFYEVVDIPYPREIIAWVEVLDDFVMSEHNNEVYDIAENLVRKGYRVIKVTNK